MTHEQALQRAIDMAPHTNDCGNEGFRFIGDRWIAAYVHDWHGKTEEDCDIKIALFHVDPQQTTICEYYTPQQTEGE